nr:FAD-dependent oxidoreductase [Marinicella sp. W31]MDC2878484.1 FAD-dependent oxidoreductase [Marinicella sp. W31]
MTRAANPTEPVDIFVIGGGVNGVGIARDAAGRGLTVALAEMNDLASATSSASTKLFHGGLRYLEYYEFRLVREALIEREVLMKAMPHISWPMRFVLPHHKGLRPWWLLRLGLFLYDHLGGRKILPATRSLDLKSDTAGKPLKSEYRRAFEYSDCWVQDARLVSLMARDAAERGVDVKVRTKVTHAEQVKAPGSDTPCGKSISKMKTALFRLSMPARWLMPVAPGLPMSSPARSVSTAPRRSGWCAAAISLRKTL